MLAFFESTKTQWELARGATIVVASLAVGTLALALFRPCRLSVAENTFILAGSLTGALVSAILVLVRTERWPASIRRGIVVLLLSALALQFTISNMNGAATRARQKRAMAEMRGLSSRIESGETVRPGLDPWGHAYQLSLNREGHTIVSLGECSESDIGKGQTYSPGTTNETTNDIVLSNGRFIRYPEGIQNQ
jgi:hypothetical protein